MSKTYRNESNDKNDRNSTEDKNDHSNKSNNNLSEAAPTMRSDDSSSREKSRAPSVTGNAGGKQSPGANKASNEDGARNSNSNSTTNNHRGNK